LRRRSGCGNRILAVELSDKRFGDISIGSRVKKRHLGRIYDHSDAASPGVNFKSFANL
jgi:hypothetical protein